MKERGRKEEAEKQQKLFEERVCEERKRKLKGTQKELHKQHEEHQSRLKAAEGLVQLSQPKISTCTQV